MAGYLELYYSIALAKMKVEKQCRGARRLFSLFENTLSPLILSISGAFRLKALLESYPHRPRQ
jgi:hypothetical protein